MLDLAGIIHEVVNIPNPLHGTRAPVENEYAYFRSRMFRSSSSVRLAMPSGRRTCMMPVSWIRFGLSGVLVNMPSCQVIVLPPGVDRRVIDGGTIERRRRTLGADALILPDRYQLAGIGAANGADELGRPPIMHVHGEQREIDPRSPLIRLKHAVEQLVVGLGASADSNESSSPGVMFQRS